MKAGTARGGRGSACGSFSFRTASRETKLLTAMRLSRNMKLTDGLAKGALWRSSRHADGPEGDKCRVVGSFDERCDRIRPPEVPYRVRDPRHVSLSAPPPNEGSADGPTAAKGDPCRDAASLSWH